MKNYRITSDGLTVLEKTFLGKKSAKKWMNSLFERGVVSGLTIRLEEKVMTEEQASALPPFSSGKKQSAWRLV